jgi:hypothetical protein
MKDAINTLNAELNSIFHLLALLGAHTILHVSRIRGFFFYKKDVKVLTVFFCQRRGSDGCLRCSRMTLYNRDSDDGDHDSNIHHDNEIKLQLMNTNQ